MPEITTSRQLAAGLEINPRGFVFNPVNGDIYTANDVAVYILQRIQQGMGEDDIVAAVAGTFDAGEAAVRSDLTEFVKLLADINIMGGLS